jgi:DnaJ-class molecular chaperone
LVFINVAIPKSLTSRQRELFEELADSLGTAVVVEEKSSFVDRIKEALGL